MCFSRIRSYVRLALFALAASGASSVLASPSTQVTTDAAGMLQLGERLERASEFAKAQQVYETLGEDRSTDIRAEARFRLARMAMQRGDWQDAALLLRRVLDDRPNAAPVRLTLAQVLTEIGDEGAALRELRAAQAIGLPLDVARMVDRFSEALRARRPLGASLEVALAPDSNINNATGRDTLGTVIGDFDIDSDGKARSGVGVSLRGSAYVRRPVTNSVNLLARASANGDLYRHRDFNNILLDAGAGPEFHLGPVRLNLEAGASRRWYGMRPFEDRLRLELNGAVPAGRRAIVRTRLSMGKVNNHLNDLQDGRLWSGEIGIERALDARTGVGLTLGGDRADLSDPGYSTKSWRGQFVAWREIGRTTVSATAAYGKLEADERLSLFPERREDRYWRLGLGATMRQLQFGGFAPFVRFSLERNDSNIAFYDYRRRRVEFGLVRAF